MQGRDLRIFLCEGRGNYSACCSMLLISLEFRMGRQILLGVIFALVLRKVGELHSAFLGTVLVLVFLV